MFGGRFGEFVRGERQAKELGLREMAKMIGVSPTYLSKVERDEFPPPAEDKVKAIAKVIGCNEDELLARAGRVSTDLSDIIKHRPVELAALLRTTKNLTTADIVRAREVLLRWVLLRKVQSKFKFTELPVLDNSDEYAGGRRSRQKASAKRT